MSFMPSDKKVGQHTTKNAVNWKLVPVSGLDKVMVVMYDSDGSHIWETSPVDNAIRIDSEKGSIVSTRSGSLYFLSDAEKHASLWEVGLQVKRPDVYKSLTDNKIL